MPKIEEKVAKKPVANPNEVNRYNLTAESKKGLSHLPFSEVDTFVRVRRRDFGADKSLIDNTFSPIGVRPLTRLELSTSPSAEWTDLRQSPKKFPRGLQTKSVDFPDLRDRIVWTSDRTGLKSLFSVPLKVDYPRLLDAIMSTTKQSLPNPANWAVPDRLRRRFEVLAEDVLDDEISPTAVAIKSCEDAISAGASAMIGGEKFPLPEISTLGGGDVECSWRRSGKSLFLSISSKGQRRLQKVDTSKTPARSLAVVKSPDDKELLASVLWVISNGEED